jgi:tungstate transport system substrate-binding protein
LLVEHDARGTGDALERGKRGGIDLVIAHAPALEKQFVAEGWALGRHPLAANEFLLVGPRADPAQVRGLELLQAFRAVGQAQALGFILLLLTLGVNVVLGLVASPSARLAVR